MPGVLHERSMPGLLELPHALMAGTQLGQLDGEQCPDIRLGIADGILEGMQYVGFGLLQLVDIGPVVVADA